MDIQQKKSGLGGGVILRLAILTLIVPLVIWLDVLAILWRDQGILNEGLHDFHNRLPAMVQLFLWLGLPLIATVLGIISLRLGTAPKLSRWVIATSVILAVLSLLAAVRSY